MDISFIIVNWNTKDYILNCVQSIYDNTNDLTTEIILVDNGSSDGSCKIAKDKYPCINIIKNNENVGFAKANNIGISEAKGRYLCLINSDVIIMKGCIEKMFKFIELNNNIGIIGPKVLNKDMTLQYSCKNFPTLWNTFCRAMALDKLFPNSKYLGSYMMTYFKYNEIKRVDVLSGCFWMVRQTAIKYVGLLDERFFIYSEDKDWCKRFHDGKWDVIFFPDAKIIHFGGASSAIDPERFYIEMYKANIKYWDKHFASVYNVLYKIIIFFHLMLRLSVYILLFPIIKNSSTLKIKFKCNIALLKFMVTQ